MQFDLVSWLIGVPTGIGINWLSQWLYHKFLRKKRRAGDYFTATYSKDVIDFEGSVKTRVPVEKVMQKLLEPTKNEEDTENPSAQDNQTP